MKLRNIRKFKLSILLVLGLFMLSGCSVNEENTTPDYCLDYVNFPTELTNIGNGKHIYVTSLGQTNDLDQVSFILDDMEVEYTVQRFLDVNSIENDSIVFVCVGSSSKSMEMSGTNMNNELNRAKSLVNKAFNNETIDLIGIHIGGKARRGENSDKLINEVFPYTIFNIYLIKGDYDGYIHTICELNNVKCMSIDSYYSLKTVFDDLILG